MRTQTFFTQKMNKQRNQQVKNILNHLCEGIYEKEEVIKLAFLTAVGGESIFLLGPPGVAKSLIARRLKFAFKDGKSFEYLMNKFSTPDEVFGPVSIKKLKDEDKYERLTDKYLPGANVVFLDEIWKAGPSIQNALLTIINEKIYRNGEEEEKVDIKCIISASNELPPGGEGLEALWDRFLIRYLISEIKEKGNFLNMITSTKDVYDDPLPDAHKLTNETLEAWQEGILQVKLPEEVLNTIQIIKKKIETANQEEGLNLQVYDRRWKKVIQLLRTAAFLNGRDQVDLMDCFLIIHCLWQHPEQLEQLQNMVAATIKDHGYTLSLNLHSVKKEIREFEDEVYAETRIVHTTEEARPKLIDEAYYELPDIHQLYDGKYIKSEDYERLRLDELRTIGLYNEEKSLTYKIKAKKGDAAHKIQVYQSSQYHTFAVTTEMVEEERYLYKKPHPIVKKYWDERIEDLNGFIAGLRKKLTEETPSEVHHLEQNLFVPAELSEIVKSNLNQAVNTVNTEALKVEKLQHYYHRLTEQQS